MPSATPSTAKKAQIRSKKSADWSKTLGTSLSPSSRAQTPGRGLNAYNGSAGLEVRCEVPMEIASAPRTVTAETRPDMPTVSKAAEVPKAAEKVADEPLWISHGTDNSSFQNLGGLGRAASASTIVPEGIRVLARDFMLALGKAVLESRKRRVILRAGQRKSGPRQVLAR